MNRYDSRGSLASRDIVSRAIDSEMKSRGDDFVYLDGTHLNSDELKAIFRIFMKKCTKGRD